MRAAWSVLIAGLVACGGPSDDNTERVASPCTQLREHLVDLRVSTARGTPTQLADHRAAMERALGDGFVTSCEKNLDATQIDCSLRASDLNAASACATQRQ